MDDINQIIARIPAWKGAREVEVERIGGLTNVNYRVTVDKETPAGNEVYADALYWFMGLAQHGMQQAGLNPAVEGFDYLEFAAYLFAHKALELQGRYKRLIS
jgi:hypothetical protein